MLEIFYFFIMALVFLMMAGIIVAGIWLFKNKGHGDINHSLNDIQTKIVELTAANKQTLDANRSVLDLQNILKAPKMRGVHGEFLLEEQLARLPHELFKTQFRFKNGSICDAVLLIRDHLLPVDSKFSLENFQRMINATSEEESKQFEREFSKDVKNRINEIKTKYILQDEGTLGFALMYIPAEGVYYNTFIKNGHENGLHDYALRNNVYPVSPNLLLPYFEILLFGLRSLKIEANTRKIHQGLLDIQSGLELFGKTYRKATDQLRNAQKNFETGAESFSDLQSKLKVLAYQDDLKSEEETSDLMSSMQ